MSSLWDALVIDSPARTPCGASCGFDVDAHTTRPSSAACSRLKSVLSKMGEA